MPKISSDLRRHALNGPVMGTRWSALFFAPSGLDPAPVAAALQRAVDEVDAQMSVWRADSDLMRLNAAPADAWVALPGHLMAVLALGLDIGRASGGAFDIGMGDAVAAWGFGPAPADPGLIRRALAAPRRPAHELLELELEPAANPVTGPAFGPAAGRARKRAPVVLDLNGIAKGYGVDRLAETLRGHGIEAALVGIDGELRAMGLRPDGSAWPIAVEAPDPARRAVHSVLELQDAAVATSGDYRHRVRVGGRELSHTMDPRRGGPLLDPPASVTVVAQGCAAADAWAGALMVLGPDQGAAMARRQGLDALFLLRDGAEIRAQPVGGLFAAG